MSVMERMDPVCMIQQIIIIKRNNHQTISIKGPVNYRKYPLIRLWPLDGSASAIKSFATNIASSSPSSSSSLLPTSSSSSFSQLSTFVRITKFDKEYLWLLHKPFQQLEYHMLCLILCRGKLDSAEGPPLMRSGFPHIWGGLGQLLLIKTNFLLLTPLLSNL